MRTLGFASLVLLASCGRNDKVVVGQWNQFHGDEASSGQKFSGTRAVTDATGALSAVIGPVAYSSPVVAPDGSVYVATYRAAPEPATSTLLRISTTGSVSVLSRVDRTGQFSTPAVDAAGNVYVARYVNFVSEADLLSFAPDGQLRFDRPLGKAKVVASPKLVETTNGPLLFVFTSGGTPIGGHVFVVNGAGRILRDVWTCSVVEGGNQPGFHIPGIDLGPPYPEGPAAAVRALQTERGKKFYLVAAANNCGVSFFSFELGATSNDPPTFTTIKVLDNDAPFAYNSPAISADGTVVIAGSDKRVTAYDVTTGIQKWHFDAAAFVGATPTFLPLAINFVYIATYDKIVKLDLSDGHVVAEISTQQSDASPAAGGQNIFVSTTSGLSTYDLDLKLLGFTSLPGGQSSPAIDANSGRIYLATTDGRFFVFPSP